MMDLNLRRSKCERIVGKRGCKEFWAGHTGADKHLWSPSNKADRVIEHFDRRCVIFHGASHPEVIPAKSLKSRPISLASSGVGRGSQPCSVVRCDDLTAQDGSHFDQG